MLNKDRLKFLHEKEIFKNIVGAFVIKGFSMLLSLFTMPAYIKYFSDNEALGIWFTMLSVLSWITMFDFGIGNGLRNKLAIALANKEDLSAKQYISSAYVSITVISVLLLLVFLSVQGLFNWNSILNVSGSKMSDKALGLSMRIIVCGIIIRFVFSLATSIIYALQKSAINNFIVLISNFSIFIFVSFSKGYGSVDSNLVRLSWVQTILSNAPLAIATLILFVGPLRNCKPKLKTFDMDKAKEILNIGVILLWLQIVAMIVLSTHAFLITRFIGPSEVVEYNVYYKVYSTIASMLILALTPIWSAVTKAYAQKNYAWIIRLYKFLLLFPIVVLLLDALLFPFLQSFFNVWLGESIITVKTVPVLIISLFDFFFVLHNVNTSINNGLSNFKIQNIWMSIAAMLMIPLSFILSNLMGNWTAVVLACCVSILPYELIQPLQTFRYLKEKTRSAQTLQLSE